MWLRSRPHRSAPVELVLYTKPGCHLCEEMKAVVDRVIETVGDGRASLREVDISRDAALRDQYGGQIPVLFVNGRKAFKYRLTERALRDRLKKEAGLRRIEKE